jgi:hypothetical protein
MLALTAAAGTDLFVDPAGADPGLDVAGTRLGG